MATLLDTNILGRLANRADAAHAIASAAVAELHRRSETLHITPQNLVEFHNIATRPVSVNGLGLSCAAAMQLAATFEASFTLLEETPDIYTSWKALVNSLGVVGKQVHDARLVAVCHAHGMTHLLTFDVSHFSRLAGFGPGLVIVDPAAL